MKSLQTTISCYCRPALCKGKFLVFELFVWEGVEGDKKKRHCLGSLSSDLEKKKSSVKSRYREISWTDHSLGVSHCTRNLSPILSRQFLENSIVKVEHFWGEEGETLRWSTNGIFFSQSLPFTGTAENFHISLVKVHGNHPSSLPLACVCNETCLASSCTPFNTSFLHDFPHPFLFCSLWFLFRENADCWLLKDGVSIRCCTAL